MLLLASAARKIGASYIYLCVQKCARIDFSYLERGGDRELEILFYLFWIYIGLPTPQTKKQHVDRPGRAEEQNKVSVWRGVADNEIIKFRVSQNDITSNFQLQRGAIPFAIYADVHQHNLIS